MGAETFTVTSRGATAQAAFSNAVQNANHEQGHGGYTGSIAEKNSFVMISMPADYEGTFTDYAEELLDEGDPRVDDKWGPAGCIQMASESFLFFGWASS